MFTVIHYNDKSEVYLVTENYQIPISILPCYQSNELQIIKNIHIITSSWGSMKPYTVYFPYLIYIIHQVVEADVKTSKSTWSQLV